MIYQTECEICCAKA